MEASNRIFADSNYFIALFNPADALHLSARTATRMLEESRYTLVITNLIFLETVTVLSHKKDRDGARAAGLYLQGHPRIESLYVDEDLHEETWRLFQSVSHKNISFVDCSTVAVMRAEHITRLLTFDTTDFRKLKREYSFSFFQ